MNVLELILRHGQWGLRSKEQLRYSELVWGAGAELAEMFWDRISGEANGGHSMGVIRSRWTKVYLNTWRKLHNSYRGL